VDKGVDEDVIGMDMADYLRDVNKILFYHIALYFEEKNSITARLVA
jgi:hypothetical protein